MMTPENFEDSEYHEEFFAAGLFNAVAIFECRLTEPYMLDAVLGVISLPPQFFQGLEVLRLQIARTGNFRCTSLLSTIL